MVEILVSLYDHILNIDPNNPESPDRDRFILSKGHGCLSLYAILGLKGFFPKKEWEGYCKFNGILGGHPERSKVPGVEASTGSLGHGLSIGVGMALHAKLDQKNFHTYVLLGDGECNEGSVWEAALSANQHQLSNLTALVDYNKYQSYASTKEVCDLEPFADKWKSFGFSTHEINIKEKPMGLIQILNEKSDVPRAIICHTIKGMGSTIMEGNLDWHHKSRMPEEEIDKIQNSLEVVG